MSSIYAGKEKETNQDHNLCFLLCPSNFPICRPSIFCFLMSVTHSKCIGQQIFFGFGTIFTYERRNLRLIAH